ncbi:hypothetical protein HY085_03390 [Candidatus Gottesmanbacteria bacterium]|nr:hypothetical protein [Candidatus Gottesmanbacteria bacterium]
MDPTPTPVSPPITPPPLVIPSSGSHKMFFLLGFIFILILALGAGAVYFFFLKPAVTPKIIVPSKPAPVVETTPATTSAVPATYFHKVCLGSACKVVDCAPPTVPCTDSCATDAACGATVSTHKECRNRACVIVNGAGKDTCTSDVSCQPKAVAPPIPQAGNVLLTIGGLVLGVGVMALGLLFVI